MIAFDTDVLTEILLGNPKFTERANRIPAGDQAVPVIVIEEILRGRLNMIRQAEAGKAKITLERAYELFQRSLIALRPTNILPYTSQAETLYQEWRQQKIRAPSHDLRIGAICIVHAAELRSRNRKDFERIPGLKVEFWD
jgi:tRNA(fMet)-specific endonuclease VapC